MVPVVKTHKVEDYDFKLFSIDANIVDAKRVYHLFLSPVFSDYVCGNKTTDNGNRIGVGGRFGSAPV